MHNACLTFQKETRMEARLQYSHSWWLLPSSSPRNNDEEGSSYYFIVWRRRPCNEHRHRLSVDLRHWAERKQDSDCHRQPVTVRGAVGHRHGAIAPKIPPPLPEPPINYSIGTWARWSTHQRNCRRIRQENGRTLLWSHGYHLGEGHRGLHQACDTRPTNTWKNKEGVRSLQSGKGEEDQIKRRPKSTR